VTDVPLRSSSTGLKTPLPVLPAAPRTLPVGGERQISPTDVSQFIRLEQCERYLRLRLHERSANRAFMRDYGVAPQAITPLLTRSGAAFESAVEGAVVERFETVNFARDRADARSRRARRASSSSRGWRSTSPGGASGATSTSCASSATTPAPCGR
jgi:hypothetical protein